jgi:hypothetical protein
VSFHQVGKDLEGLWPQLDVLPAAPQAAPVQIEHDIPARIRSVGSGRHIHPLRADPAMADGTPLPSGAGRAIAA